MTGARPVALITGAGKRVGRAIALEFARSGCDLVVTCHTSLADAKTLAEEAAGDGATTRIEQLDLSDLDGATQWAERLSGELPRLDVLVHNASVYAPTPIGSVTALAPLLLSQAFAERLATSPLEGGGAIVAMCDIHAMGRPRKDFSAYSMSKAALVEMVQTLARALAPRVRVTGVAPGVVAFPDAGYESSEAEQAAYLSRVPLGRAGTPQDAARTVRWLALEAPYVTGEILRLDGGRWLA